MWQMGIMCEVDKTELSRRGGMAAVEALCRESPSLHPGKLPISLPFYNQGSP